MEENSSTSRESGGDSLARGALALLGVQLVFLIGGYAVHSFLGRRLGPADYGVYGVVIAFLVWMEVSLTGGFPYAIRKFGAENAELMPAIARASMRGQVVFAALLTVAAMAAAPTIAGLLHDPGLTGLIRIASIDIPIYAFYFCFMAILNGRRSYMRQAAAMAAYAAGKVAAVILLVALGFGVMGALIGNILASVAGLIIAVAAAGRIPKATPYPFNRLVKYAGSTSILGIFFTLLISIDLFAVKAMVGTAATVGYYAAANTLARAPFLLFIGIASATLPALSKAASETDHELARKYMGQATRLHLMLLAPVVAILSGAAVGVVNLLFSDRYQSAAPALAILVVAMMLFSFLHAVYNIFVAMGDTRTPFLGTTFLIGVAAALNLWLVPDYGIVGAAVAALFTSAAGLLGSTIVCIGRFGVFISPAVVVRITAAAALIYLAAATIKVQGIALVGFCAALFLAYTVLLIGLGEIRRVDIAKITSAVGLRKPEADADTKLEGRSYENPVN